MIDPEVELAERRARQRRANVRNGLILLGIGIVGAVAWIVTRPAPESPEHALFARTLPAWSIEKLNFRPGDQELAALLDASAKWPEVRTAMEAVTRAYGGDTEAFRGTVKELNAAIEKAKLAYWVDAPRTAGKQWITTYEILGKSTWTLDGGGSTDVLRVRRLDRVNLEMAFLGHADGSTPVVLVDRVESELLDLMKDAYDTIPRAGAAESASRGAWRTAMQGVADAEVLSQAWKLLAARHQRFQEMLVGNGRRVEMEEPERIEWGEEWLESLESYADLKRPGGPLIMPAPLRHVREADRPLREGAAREALDNVLAVMALSTEAHEARHALEPFGDKDPPPLILEEAGDDDLRFARMAANEAIAYLGQLHASDRPCQVLSMLVQRAAGDHARATPHHYASRAILRSMAGNPERMTSAVLEEFLLEACRKPADELRKKAAEAHQTIFGSPFLAAHRSH